MFDHKMETVNQQIAKIKTLICVLPLYDTCLIIECFADICIYNDVQ